MKVDYKDLAERAFWTFVQTLIAMLVATGTDYIHLASWKTAAISAGAAVLSALKTALLGVGGVNQPPV